MALIDDVRSVLEDDELREPEGFTIRRYVVTVDDDGMSVLTHVDIPADGIIVPSAPLGVVRTPEAERQGDNITVFTMTAISSGDASIGQPADDIVYNDLLWRVTAQDGWDRWHFNVANAVLASPGGRPIT